MSMLLMCAVVVVYRDVVAIRVVADRVVVIFISVCNGCVVCNQVGVYVIGVSVCYD